MRSIIFFIWLFTALSIAQEKPEMEVYIKNNNMERQKKSLEERMVLMEQNMKNILKKINKLKL